MLHIDVKIRRDQLQSDPKVRKEYQEWLRDPMTQRIIDIMTLEGLPTLMNAVDAQSASHVLGHAAGWANCVNRMQMLDVKPAPEVEATFDHK